MNEKQTGKVVLMNLAYWAVAIFFPIIVRLVPTGSGSPPKIFDVLIPLFQIMLAFGATHLLMSSMEKKTAG